MSSFPPPGLDSRRSAIDPAPVDSRKFPARRVASPEALLVGIIRMVLILCGDCRLFRKVRRVGGATAANSGARRQLSTKVAGMSGISTVAV